MNVKLPVPKKRSVCMYDPDTMEYKHVKRPWLITYITAFGAICILLGSVIFSTSERIHTQSQVIDYEEVPLILDCNLEFSEQAMYDLLVHMNVRFPHIVIAQARIESGNYTSAICNENNNMFGMKCAKSRATTNIGENRNHAVYETWQECVIDYAFYQTTYMRKAKTEEQYLSALSASYAEGGTVYGDKVRSESKKVLAKYTKKED